MPKFYNSWKLYCTSRTDIKYSTNRENTQYKVKGNNSVLEGDPDVNFLDLLFNIDDKTIYTHGAFFCEKPDLSNLITKEEFDPVLKVYESHLSKGSLGLINGLSIEDGNDINIDLSLTKIVSSLPTENIQDNKIYIVPTVKTSNETEFAEYVWSGTKWDLLGVYKTTVDLSDYLKTVDADKKYMKLSNGGATISVSSKNGLLNNFGDNGLAFNAVRDCGANTLTGKAINAGAFGVKLDGTTAFSHKIYDTYIPSTGTYTGAKNTAVLTFSGPTGLRYAKNDGSAADVTDAMYKYVGVIDSPDEKLNVYSATHVDALIKGLQDLIDELKSQILQ